MGTVMKKNRNLVLEIRDRPHLPTQTKLHIAMQQRTLLKTLRLRPEIPVNSCEGIRHAGVASRYKRENVHNQFFFHLEFQQEAR